MAGPLVEGVFLARENRFRALVAIEGEPTGVHVPNPGRMHELFEPGRRVLLAHRPAPHRVTDYDLVVVDLEERLVSLDSRLPVRLVRAALEHGALPGFAVPLAIRSEVPVGASRIDFELVDESGPVLLEVKSCTLVEEAVALFPDAPTLRGARHVGELERTVRAGGRAAIVVVVQRDDARLFRPHEVADHAFAAALRAAAATGVAVHAVGCQVTCQWVATDTALEVRL